jgi:hypothetical protein
MYGRTDHARRVAPGSISLLTHAAQSHWWWSEAIEVTHLYLSAGAIAEVAAQAYERQVRDVELLDVLKTDDPLTSRWTGPPRQLPSNPKQRDGQSRSRPCLTPCSKISPRCTGPNLRDRPVPSKNQQTGGKNDG